METEEKNYISSNDYDKIGLYHNMCHELLNNCPLSIKLTILCTLLAQFFPYEKLSKEEFLKTISENISILIDR
jgi:hypothetical protein